jgi:hypothetical protein
VVRQFGPGAPGLGDPYFPLDGNGGYDEVGDEEFFEILREWAVSRKGDNVITSEFIGLAEDISGEDLDAFFEAWLFTPARPAGIEPRAGRTGSVERASKGWSGGGGGASA